MFMGHYGRRIRWKHSFLRLTQLEVKVRSNRVKSKKSVLEHAYLVQLCLRIPKNDFCFDVQRLEMPENCFWKKNIKKFCHGLTLKLLRSGQIIFHCEMCWWNVNEWYQTADITSIFFHLFNFGHISGRFTSVCNGIRIWRSGRVRTTPSMWPRPEWAVKQAPPSQPGAVSAKIRIHRPRPGRTEGRYLLDRLHIFTTG